MNQIETILLGIVLLLVLFGAAIGAIFVALVDSFSNQPIMLALLFLLVGYYLRGST